MRATVSLLWILLSLAPSASAQSQDATARARALFAEGVELTDAGDWEAAVGRFEEALALKDAPAIRYNFALALIELGRFQEAADQLTAVVDSPEAGRMAEPARETQADLRRRAARLTVRLTGGQGDETLFVDDDPVDVERLDSPLWLTPGAHVLIVQRGSRELAREEVTMAAGQAGVATLDLVPGPGETAAQATDPENTTDRPPVVTEPDEPGHEGAPLWAHWTALGSVAATVITVFAVSLAN